MDSPAEYLTPDEITGPAFETKRKGLDPAAVSAHLHAVSESMRAVLSDNEALRDDVAQLRREAEEATASPVEFDDDELRKRIGDKAVDLVDQARTEAGDIRAEAEADALRIRAEAESVFADRSAAADEAADRLRTEARDALREERADAEAEAHRLVNEAQIVRKQILEDLARRRSLARRQIEQLRAGRERLISSHDALRRTLDELSTELSVSMSEARAAAETAGHSVPETSIEDLEAEIETARLSGLLDTGPVPIITTPADDDAADESVDSPDPVNSDPTVADLFERMRSNQRRSSVDSKSRTNDSLSQR